jgi:hypothetical protein
MDIFNFNTLTPYYFNESGFSVSNKEKAKLGETAFAEALQDYSLMVNVTYGKRQKDIDHLVFTGKYVIMNECKNTNEGFFMHYSWFISHVANRFTDGLPIAQHYANIRGYKNEDIRFTLTIPKLNCDETIKLTLTKLKIHIIETGIQLLKEEDKVLWHKVVKNNILSVINSPQVNTRDPLSDNSSSFSLQGSDLTKPVLSAKKTVRSLKND